MRTQKHYLYFIILVVALTFVVGCKKSVPPPVPTPEIPTATLSPTPGPTSTVDNAPYPTPIPATPVQPTPMPTETRMAVTSPITYIVQPGDTLSAIAWEYDTTVDKLLEVNQLTSDLIIVGQVLTIPSDEPIPGTPIAERLIATPVMTSTAPQLTPIEPTFVTGGDRAHPYVALTFDACQTASNPAGYDEALINVLMETQTPATLFLGGLWMQSHPTQTVTLAATPLFELGNHSWSHLDFAKLSPEVMTQEILLTQDMMYSLVGRQPTLFRLPFGTYNDTALAVIGQHGLRTIQWDVVTGDPDPNISAEDIVRTVLRETRNGSIIIMHMNGRGWHTAEALPELIQQLRAKGYTFVTVSQLLGLETLQDG